MPTEYRCAFEELERWPMDDRWYNLGQGESLEKWKGHPPFVVIKGDFGLGKTKLGVEILDRLVLNRVVPSYRFIAAAEVPAVCFSGEPGDWKALLAEPALLLDDLGRGYQGDAAMAVSRLVNHRWGWRLPTVFPTNLRADSGNVADGALLDRLNSGLVVQLEGESRRKPR